MYLFRTLTRRGALLLCAAVAALQSLAGVVYFDNSSTNWNPPYLYCWNSSQNNSWEVGWPGSSMTRVGNSNIWSYNVPSDKDMVIISNNGSNQSGDLNYAENHVYTKSGDSGKTYEEYISSNPDPVEPVDPDPTPTGDVYVYVNGSWTNVHAYIYNESVSPAIENAAWPGVAMTSGGPNGYWYYKVPANLRTGSRVIINTNNGNTNRYPADLQPGMELNGKSMVFTVSGSGWSEYVGSEPTPSRPLGAFVSAADDGTAVTITAENGKLVITPYSPEVVKIFTLPSDWTAEERRSISVCAKPDADYTTDSDDKNYYISMTGGVRVTVDKQTCIVKFSNADGSDALIESSGLQNRKNNCSVSFEGMGETGFYGGGYGGWMNLADKTLVMNNTQTGGWPNDDDRSYHNICIPFYVSTAGYGVYFDDHYINARIYPSAGGSSYTSSSETPVAYYFIGGGNMERVIENYTFLTGRQDLPPYWTLGYITSKFSFASRAKAEEAVRKTKEAKIPLDGIVFDIH